MAATITLGKIRDLYALHEQGVSHAEPGQMYGLSQDAVDFLCHGAQRRPGCRQRRLPGMADRARDGPSAA